MAYFFPGRRLPPLACRSLVEPVPDAVWITSATRRCRAGKVLLIANDFIAQPILLNEKCSRETIPYILGFFQMRRAGAG